MMKSLWEENHNPMDTDDFADGDVNDVIVVGAGLTGLSTAVLLLRAGLKVTVLEAGSIGSLASGKTTAKASLLQGRVLTQVGKHHSPDVVHAYVESNKEALAWLLRYLDERGVDVQRRDAFTYATGGEGERRLTAERDIARAAGLNVQWAAGDIGLPFTVAAALKLEDQAQFDPLDVLEALAQDIRERGGRIVQGVRVRKVCVQNPAAVDTDQGRMHAQQVVLATGMPITDRALHFARVSHSRSYLAAYRAAGDSGALPQGMYLSIEQTSRSLRTAPTRDGDYLLVGGGAHPVGAAGSELRRLEELDHFTRSWFPGLHRTHRWSAQDYQPAGAVPLVRAVPGTGERIFAATGYNKWGMTNAVASALRLSAEILGGSMPWAEALAQRGSSAQNVIDGLKINAGVAGKLASGWGSILIESGRTPSLPVRRSKSAAGPTIPRGDRTDRRPEGHGEIRREGLQPVAESTVNGVDCRVSAVCTHLGGILRWNDAEKSWDCPLHGSRFTVSGQVIEGPAVRDLKNLDAACADHAE